MLLSIGSHPHLVGVGDDLREVLGVERVQDVEEVLPRRRLALGVLGGEEGEEVAVLLDVRPQRLDRELVVVGHRDVPHLALPQQLLVLRQHFLEEVLVDHVFWGQVELDYRGVRQQ